MNKVNYEQLAKINADYDSMKQKLLEYLEEEQQKRKSRFEKVGSLADKYVDTSGNRFFFTDLKNFHNLHNPDDILEDKEYRYIGKELNKFALKKKRESAGQT